MFAFGGDGTKIGTSLSSKVSLDTPGLIFPTIPLVASSQIAICNLCAALAMCPPVPTALREALTEPDPNVPTPVLDTEPCPRPLTTLPAQFCTLASVGLLAVRFVG